ncbi:AI-2E family transporter [Halobaculum rubrum]|uniref:AI-2E family transporter n=1 Tax=Halobaculum rubrum TaxID=2872158 RepID=UPI001CA3AE12|nr:AI-2E family transporter [Halobaculum rubrum]QZY00927.1 AI-2E family transporter [Halobaculum rubrum]
MTAEDTEARWPSDRTGLSFLAVVSIVFAALIVLTQLPYIILAIVLAYVLTPAQQRLERRLSAGSAAFTLTAISVLLLFVLVTYIVTIAIQQGLALFTAIQAGEFSSGAVESHVATIGHVVDLEALYATYQGPIGTGLERLATGALIAIDGLPSVFIGLTVTTFVLFVLLRDGTQLVAWLRTVVPVSEPVQRELMGELDDLMWASVVGNVAVAGIQAVLLGTVLVLVDMPGFVFLTVVTFVLCLLPLVGAFGVWVPASVFLLAMGRPVAALIIVGTGSVVSVSDTYLRPLIINRSGALNVAVITVGIFGGIIVFGVVGLFIGPVVLGGTRVILDQFARERAESTSG